MSFYLDSSVIVNYFRRKPGYDKLLSAVAKQGEINISIIILAEVIYGIYRSADPRREREKLNAFLSDFEVKTQTITEEIIEIYAETKMFLERKGEKLDDFDLLVGATAAASDATLVTDNIKHFTRFPKLEIYKEGW